MYEINDICYAGKCEKGICIHDVKVLQGDLFLMTFSTGETRIFDPMLLKGSAFAPLQDKNYSEEFLAVSWNIDMVRW